MHSYYGRFLHWQAGKKMALELKFSYPHGNLAPTIVFDNPTQCQDFFNKKSNAFLKSNLHLEKTSETSITLICKDAFRPISLQELVDFLALLPTNDAHLTNNIPLWIKSYQKQLQDLPKIGKNPLFYRNLIASNCNDTEFLTKYNYNSEIRELNNLLAQKDKNKSPDFSSITNWLSYFKELQARINIAICKKNMPFTANKKHLKKTAKPITPHINFGNQKEFTVTHLLKPSFRQANGVDFNLEKFLETLEQFSQDNKNIKSLLLAAGVWASFGIEDRIPSKKNLSKPLKLKIFINGNNLPISKPSVIGFYSQKNSLFVTLKDPSKVSLKIYSIVLHEILHALALIISNNDATAASPNSEDEKEWQRLAILINKEISNSTKIPLDSPIQYLVYSHYDTAQWPAELVARYAQIIFEKVDLKPYLSEELIKRLDAAFNKFCSKAQAWCERFIANAGLSLAVNFDDYFSKNILICTNETLLNISVNGNHTPLDNYVHQAAECKNFNPKQLINQLTKQGINISIIFLAAIRVQADSLINYIFKNEINSSYKFSEAEVITAIQYGRIDILKRLIKFKVNLNLTTRHGDAPLHYAAAFDQANSLALLLKSGASFNSFNSKGFSPFHTAVSHGSLESLKKLAEKQDLTQVTLSNKFNLLHLAAECGEENIIDYLVRFAHIWINESDGYGNAALHFAIVHHQSIKKLVELNADLEIQNHDGYSPLMLAILYKNDLASEYLARHSKNINAVNYSGQSALTLAIASGYTKIADILIARKAVALYPGNTHQVFFAIEFDQPNYFQAITSSNTTESYLYGKDNFRNYYHSAVTHKARKVFSFLLSKVNDSFKDLYPFFVTTISERLAQNLDSKDIYLNMLQELLGLMNISKHFSSAIYALVLRITQKTASPQLVTADQMILETLLQHDNHPDINTRFTEAGNTPLHLAALNNNLKLWVLLLKHGALIDILNAKNESPLDIALNHNSLELLKFYFTPTEHTTRKITDEKSIITQKNFWNSPKKQKREPDVLPVDEAQNMSTNDVTDKTEIHYCT